MKANEAKLESDKRRLKEVLDASESRSVKLELQRRALEGELQRSRLGLSDREVQVQALQERADSLQRQVGPPDLPRARASWGPCSPSSPARQRVYRHHPISQMGTWRLADLRSLPAITELSRGRAKTRLDCLMMESALKGGVWRDRDFTHFLFFL